MRKLGGKPNQPHLNEVIDYYYQTDFDYKIAWDNSPSPAIHFGLYDEHADKHQQAVQNTNRAIADLTGIRPGESALDAGCGRGGTSLWLARHRSCRCTGVSIVPGQIHDALQLAQEQKLDELCDFVIADYCDIPKPDASFDRAFALESLCHASRKADFYREAFRLLKPGGSLGIFEYVRNSRPLAAKDERLLHGWLSRWSIPDIDTLEEHRKHAESAGFIWEESQDITSQMRVSLRNLYEKARFWLPVGQLLRILKIRNRRQQGNHKAGVLQYEALKKELWHYAAIKLVKP